MNAYATWLNGLVSQLTLLGAGAAGLALLAGGLIYLLSFGNIHQAEQGKRAMIAALFGLVIVVGASTIVQIFLAGLP